MQEMQEMQEMQGKTGKTCKPERLRPALSLLVLQPSPTLSPTDPVPRAYRSSDPVPRGLLTLGEAY